MQQSLSSSYHALFKKVTKLTNYIKPDVDNDGHLSENVISSRRNESLSD